MMTLKSRVERGGVGVLCLRGEGKVREGKAQGVFMRTLQPDFICIGAQKAGSTLVNECLREHPEIYSPYQEYMYFSDPDFARRPADHFERLYQGVKVERVFGYKRPNYLALPEVPQRMAHTLPRVKLIVSFRNPVDRALSAYYHAMRGKNFPFEPHESGLRRLFTASRDSLGIIEKNVIDYGMYGVALERYFKYFDTDQVFVVFMEDIKQRGKEVFAELYEFLGVDASYTPASLNKRPMEGVYSLGHLRVARVWGLLHRKFDPVSERSYSRRGPLAMFARLAAAGMGRYVLPKVYPSKKPVLSAELRTMMTDVYREDIGLLQQITGRDLSHWLKK